MYKPLPKYLILVLLTLLVVNCKKKPDSAVLEGKIKYSISYDQEKVGGYSISILPKEMIMEFNKNKVRNSIEGGLGFFSLVHVSDLKYNKHTTWLKLIDKKYIYEGKKRESPCCFGMMEGMELEFTDSTKLIAGLDSKKVIASFPGNGMQPFDIWYTNELGLNNPNRKTPFQNIPGVLLEFNTFMGNINMHMIATKFDAQKILEKQFQPPENYRPVTKIEIETILNALMK